MTVGGSRVTEPMLATGKSRGHFSPGRMTCGFAGRSIGQTAGMSTSMAVNRDLVVIGGSAGGLDALCPLIAGLPGNLPAAVLVVLHMPAQADSALATIINRCGPLPAVPASSGEPLRPGRIHVAVPDRHLLVHDQTILLSRAPKQNRARPAIDALFRSAARWRGRRTVGVVLSGSLDDGAAGLAAIDSAGGACVVQHPADALVASMPTAALTVVPTAGVFPVAELGTAVAALTSERLGTLPPLVDETLIRETDMAETDQATPDGPRLGEPAAVSCPDCTGGMNRVESAGAVYYRCHVGHVWSPMTLLEAQREVVERSLWTAVSILEEQATIHQTLAERARGTTAVRTKANQLAAATEIRSAAMTIRKHFPEFVNEQH
jgi:two-component system, chemotaxis family, protein-glutamate methylesterase/glutaminase